jgi:hypothetical protein
VHRILIDLTILIILGEGTNYEAPHYAVSSNLPSPHPSSVQKLFSAQSPSVYGSSFNIRDQVSDPYKTSGTRRQKDFSDTLEKNMDVIFQLSCTGMLLGIRLSVILRPYQWNAFMMKDRWQ